MWGLIVAVAGIIVLGLMAGASAEEHRSAKVLRDFQRAHPCPATGLKTGACPGWVKDHIVPLCAGGADAVENLQWQTVRNAAKKDAIEKRTCARLRRHD